MGEVRLLFALFLVYLVSCRICGIAAGLKTKNDKRMLFLGFVPLVNSVLAVAYTIAGIEILFMDILDNVQETPRKKE